MASKSRPYINIDMDGVLYNFIDDMRSCVVRYSGRLPKNLPDPTTWHVWESWDMSAAEWWHIFRRGVAEGAIWRAGFPYPDAVETLWNLSDQDYHIRVVTSRLVHGGLHGRAVESTIDWLEAHNVPFRSLEFVGPEGKSHVPGIAIVDDKPANVFEWVEARGSGLGVLVARPWNDWTREDNRFSKNPRIIRTANWADIEENIRSYNA